MFQRGKVELFSFGSFQAFRVVVTWHVSKLKFLILLMVREALSSAVSRCAEMASQSFEDRSREKGKEKSIKSMNGFS